MLWCTLNFAAKLFNRLRCHRRNVRIVIRRQWPLHREQKTLEHLENPLVSGWQPGWEKVSDLSDTQMCGLLPVRGYEAGITHQSEDPASRRVLPPPSVSLHAASSTAHRHKHFMACNAYCILIDRLHIFPVLLCHILSLKLFDNWHKWPQLTNTNAIRSCNHKYDLFPL